MSTLHRLKAYFGMVPAEELDDYGADYRDDYRPGYDPGSDIGSGPDYRHRPHGGPGEGHGDAHDADHYPDRAGHRPGGRPRARSGSARREAGGYPADCCPEHPSAHLSRWGERPRWSEDYDESYGEGYGEEYGEEYGSTADAPRRHAPPPRLPAARRPSTWAAEVAAPDASGRGDLSGRDPARPDRPGLNIPVRGALAVEATPSVQHAAMSPPCGSTTEDKGHPLARIVTLHPRSYSEARPIGERYREGIPVIINLTGMDDRDAKRLVDFAAGLAFALRGSIDKITNKVFLLSPPDVEVSAEDRRLLAEGGGSVSADRGGSCRTPTSP